MQLLADASTKSHPMSFAKALPSWVETSRSVARSHLLPTSMTGAWPPKMGEADVGEFMKPAVAVGEVAFEDSLTR